MTPVAESFNGDTITFPVSIALKGALAQHLDLVLVSVAMRIHSLMASLTPVDTGYLRLTLSARLRGEPLAVPVSRDPKAAAGAYVGAWGGLPEALARFGSGKAIEIGYTADYAPYVEDKHHMALTAVRAVDSMIAEAVRTVAATLANLSATKGV